ncbi:helix-turn-helix transcriptional regulator [Polyangium mundeleinium]|uniref:AraC family transcriptional regulator n=1 Tax=Polyangium mundeleinium TaxID=2995306 RepID=A0ABT5EI86_9BACT|nr:AraC family transcriptional regulator [Polyangium mundeleinium]MDC0740637.1 AraC family transcriptional regulator [Polyangium mundeleinium]
MGKPAETSHACEFQTPTTGASVQLFRSNARSFAAESTDNARILVGVLRRGMVRTEAAGGLLVSDAREAPCVWIMPAHTTYAVTAIPGHAPEGKGTLSEPRGVALAREYLHAHPGEQVPLDQLAAVAGLSKYHLVRAFRAAVGMPPHAYQLRLRLTRSLFLLRQGQPPSAIAYELGFADQSHYTRAFRAEFGTTPGAWLRDLAPPRARARLGDTPDPAPTGARAWRATAWPSTDPRPAPRTPHS